MFHGLTIIVIENGDRLDTVHLQKVITKYLMNFIEYYKFHFPPKEDMSILGKFMALESVSFI